MIKRVINHPDWRISDIVIHNDLVFIGHFGGISNNSKTLLTIEEQTEATLQGLSDCLSQEGLSMDCILQLNVALRNIEDFNGMHSVWKKWFPKEFPARMTHTSDFIHDKCLIQVYGTGAVSK